MKHKSIKVTEEVFDKFEELRYNLRFKRKIMKTQSEMADMLVNISKEKFKAEKRA